MADACPNCGAELPAGARFCPECGAAVTIIVGAERRIATMVFADLVGSTQLAAGRDPEELRMLLNAFFEVTREVLEEYGGTVEKYIGDAVLAVFGAPRAYGDDPDRAVRASLALVQRVEALGTGLRVHIGVNTGEVLTSPASGDLAVTGEAVNVAARLEQQAEPGQVLVGERTARACRAVVLREADPIPAKGVEQPLRVWEAVGERSEPMAQTRAPLIGRDDDLDILRLVTRRAFREHVPQLATVLGDAGIGKTRLLEELVAELRDHAEPPQVFIGRNLPYGRGIAFWALGEILRQVAGSRPDDSAIQVHDALEARLAQLGAPDAEDLAGVFATALGGEDAGAERGDTDAGTEERLARAWRRLVGLLAAEKPVVLVLDDAHWADSGLLDLVEAITHGLEDAPIVVLCSARPELLEHRPVWGRASRNATLIELRPLRQEDGDLLARELLPPEYAHRAAEVATAAGGNPFFEEEIARQVAHPALGAPGRLPDTVQAAIAARIDQLPPGEKRTLQYAAVLGARFRVAALENLLGDRSPEPALDALARKELVQERVADGEGVYGFGHVLVRDVAYSSLPRSVRRQLHERAAESLEHRAGDRRRELAELVAFHLDRAAELEPSPPREARASEASAAAAEAALARGASHRAQELYEQAAERAASRADAIDFFKSAGEVAKLRFRGGDAVRLFRAAAEAAEEAGDDRQAAANYARLIEVASRFGGLTPDAPPTEELRALIRRAKELVPDEALAIRARLLADEAWLHWRGDADGMHEVAQAAVELARESGDAYVLSGALDAATAAATTAGRLGDGARTAHDRAELLERLPADSTSAFFERVDILSMLSDTLQRTGDFRDALAWDLEARALELEHDVDWTAWSRGLIPRFFLGEWDEALEDSRRMRDAWQRARRPYAAFLTSSIAPVGAIYGYRGEEAQETDWFEFAEELVHPKGMSEVWIGALRADVDLHHGCADRAASRLEVPGGECRGWWRSVWAAVRAEAYVRSGHPEAAKALAEAETCVDADRLSAAINLRTRGLFEEDETSIREALTRMRELGAAYQAARTGLLLDGPDRDEGEATYRRLGLELEAELEPAQ